MLEIYGVVNRDVFEVRCKSAKAKCDAATGVCFAAPARRSWRLARTAGLSSTFGFPNGLGSRRTLIVARSTQPPAITRLVGEAKAKIIPGEFAVAPRGHSFCNNTPTTRVVYPDPFRPDQAECVRVGAAKISESPKVARLLRAGVAVATIARADVALRASHACADLASGTSDVVLLFRKVALLVTALSLVASLRLDQLSLRDRGAPPRRANRG
jgi:hypothetical protein